MSKEGTNKKHKEIPSDGIKRERKTHKRFISGESEEKIKFSEQGKKLITQLDETIQFANRQNKIATGENVFLVIQTASSISKEDKLFNNLFKFSLQTDECSAIVALPPEGLDGFKKKLHSYSADSTFKSYFDKIRKISTVNMSKIDDDFRQLMNSQATTIADISFMPNLDEEYYKFIIDHFVRYVEEKHEEVIDVFVNDKIASVRANLTAKTIETVIEGLDSIWQITSAPAFSIEEPQSVEFSELPNINKASLDVEPICILDSGIDCDNPLLQGLILRSEAFTNDQDTKDFDGHGTFCAGIAAYGNLDNVMNRKSIEATANIINAKVYRKNSVDRGFLEKKVKNAVEKLHNDVRIFSISVMHKLCTSVSEPSNLAITLDNLANQYNVLFIIPTGNVREDLTNLVKSQNYPDYLQQDCCKIYRGAEACTAITVGGYALKENSRSIAKIEQPSPFTRRGEFNERAKPDVVANGGNLEIDSVTKRVHSNHKEIGVVSLGLADKHIAYGIGTSYSAPYVANMVARLAKVYPNAGPNLLKALIIHSAKLPDAYRAFESDPLFTNALYGKGIPSFDRCAYSQKHALTIYKEDTIRCDETASIPIYIPRMMKKIFGTKQLKITLVYNPPVARGIKGYTLVDLGFQLLKQVTQGNFQPQSQRSNWDTVFKKRWDNVKTGIFSWQHSGWGLEWLLKITPTVRFKNQFDGAKHLQKYAVVITIEDTSKKYNIYDSYSSEQDFAKNIQKDKIITQQELLTYQ